jgi:quercetin dioxygenase-like cupin family protein
MSAIEINVGQLGIRYLVDGSQNGSMGIFELTVPPASNVPPPHSHSNNEEIVYVLEGTLVSIMRRYGLVPSVPK